MGIVTEIILPLAMAFIMFALGLGLTLADFTRVAKMPRDFIIGLASQLILLPLIALFLIGLWNLPAELALGVMIIAAAPGGVTSNILTSFAKGDVALSISLTAIISLISVISIPIIIGFSYNLLFDGDGKNININKIAISVFLIVTIPVCIGLIFRQFASDFSLRFEPWAKKISAVLFALVLLGAIFQQRENIVEYFAQAGLVTLALNVVMMLVAYIIATIFASGPKQRTAISIECGLQNGTLAIAVGTLLFGGGPVIIPAATYSLIMFATALIYITLMRTKT
ncbi:MAG: symporter [Rhodospirillaceae bacterium]|nr:symporter [Rhodospirillaceae bacterium]|tara:strand:+ start:3161 stop:4009 length:849 start_codon:yes stop_codon:yes gene_type:complete